MSRIGSKQRSLTGRAIAALLGIFAVAGMIGSCSSPQSGSDGEMEGSRSVLYDSIADLAADSSLVLTVRVIDSRAEGEEIEAVTISTVVADYVYSPSMLGENLPNDLDTAVREGVDQGSVLEVVQMGTSEMGETPAPLLEVGREYLLFIVAAVGDQKGRYWVTGGPAGIFVPEGPETFVQLAETADTFSEQVTAQDLAR